MTTPQLAWAGFAKVSINFLAAPVDNEAGIDLEKEGVKGLAMQARTASAG